VVSDKGNVQGPGVFIAGAHRFIAFCSENAWRLAYHNWTGTLAGTRPNEIAPDCAGISNDAVLRQRPGRLYLSRPTILNFMRTRSWAPRFDRAPAGGWSERMPPIANSK
jgi:hypothetical protein